MKEIPVVKIGILGTNQAIAIVVGLIAWPIFFFGTFAFILALDAIECFLHTVRLHWVELNSKFYKGQNALKYNPFSFNSAM